MFPAGEEVDIYSDNKVLEGSKNTFKINKKQEVELAIPCNGGVVIVSKK